MTVPNLIALISSSCIAVAALAAASTAVAADPAVRLTRPEAWTTVFAEEEHTLRFQIEGDAAFKGRLLWSLSTEERVAIARGEVPAEIGEKPALTLKFPSVKPGVVLATVLKVGLYRGGEREPAAWIETPLHIFPKDPFQGRKETLKSLRIKLYDPPGNTAKVLEKAEFPFEPVHNIAVIAELKDGLLVIGEGVSFREDRALPELMLQAAALGVPVLCLSPAEGEIALPGVTDKELKPQNLAFGFVGVVRRLDKRLDERWWMSKPVAPERTLAPDGRGARISAEVQRGDHGWRWIEMSFERTVVDAQPAAEGPTRWIVTALPIIEQWEAGPSPRFLFTRLIDYLTLVRPEGKAPVSP